MDMPSPGIVIACTKTSLSHCMMETADVGGDLPQGSLHSLTYIWLQARFCPIKVQTVFSSSQLP